MLVVWPGVGSGGLVIVGLVLIGVVGLMTGGMAWDFCVECQALLDTFRPEKSG